MITERFILRNIQTAEPEYSGIIEYTGTEEIYTVYRYPFVDIDEGFLSIEDLEREFPGHQFINLGRAL